MKKRVLQRLSLGMAIVISVSQMSGIVSFAATESEDVYVDEIEDEEVFDIEEYEQFGDMSRVD